MIYRMAISTLVVLAAAGCSGSDATEPLRQDATLTVTPAASRSAEGAARSGSLHIAKDCSTYAGQAGQICTITSSSLGQIPVGSTVTYLSAASAAGLLDTDVVLDPPGPGNNAAFGHCTLSLVTYLGTCTFSGGTGKFTHFRARVAVSPLTLPNFAWEGSYSFGSE